MKGARVRFSHRSKGMLIGTVIAENDLCVAVQPDDDPAVPYIIPKAFVGVILR